MMRCVKAGFAWIACVLPLMVYGQQGPQKTTSLAELELTAEVATTTDDGYPSVLRATIKNVGGTTVDMPPLTPDCAPDGGIKLVLFWNSDDPDHPGGGGGGGACGMSDQGSLMVRLKRTWIRLRPGEFMTVTERIGDQSDEGKRRTIHFRVEYNPPSWTKLELAEVVSAGYVIPTERLRTPEQTFQVH